MMAMKFKFLGIEIYVSFLFAAILVIMLATDRTGLLLPSLFAIFVHEAAHLFAMWIVDCTPKKNTSYTRKHTNHPPLWNKRKKRNFCGTVRADSKLDSVYSFVHKLSFVS